MPDDPSPQGWERVTGHMFRERVEGTGQMVDLQAVRELTFDERATWGECPVCHAKAGEWCYADAGLQLGVRGDGQRMKDGEGAHLRRLRRAPLKVRLVAADG